MAMVQLGLTLEGVGTALDLEEGLAYLNAKSKRRGVALRAFPPPSPQWKNASKPFDPEMSEHATHVAGIAAGNNAFPVTTSDRGKVTLSGIAPKATTIRLRTPRVQEKATARSLWLGSPRSGWTRGSGECCSPF